MENHSNITILRSLLREIYIVNDGKLLFSEIAQTFPRIIIVTPADILHEKGIVIPFNLAPSAVNVAPIDFSSGYTGAASNGLATFFQTLRVEASSQTKPAYYKLTGNADDVDYITNLQGKKKLLKITFEVLDN